MNRLRSDKLIEALIPKVEESRPDMPTIEDFEKIVENKINKRLDEFSTRINEISNNVKEIKNNEQNRFNGQTDNGSGSEPVREGKESGDSGEVQLSGTEIREE